MKTIEENMKEIYDLLEQNIENIQYSDSRQDVLDVIGYRLFSLYLINNPLYTEEQILEIIKDFVNKYIYDFNHDRENNKLVLESLINECINLKNSKTVHFYGPRSIKKRLEEYHNMEKLRMNSLLDEMIDNRYDLKYHNKVYTHTLGLLLYCINHPLNTLNESIKEFFK